MSKHVITTDKAKAVGPYSLGVASGDYIHFSGQIPLDGATGKLVGEDIAAQTEQVFVNINTLLEAAGAAMSDIVKTTVFLTDMADFAAMNEVYQAHVAEPFPARSTIAVAALPLGAKVEIEMIVYKPTS